MSHTIMLLQAGPEVEMRTYSDYESIDECMEGVCRMYEEHLKRQNPYETVITYDMSHLFEFIEELYDLAFLVYQKDTKTYMPLNKHWVQKKVWDFLRRQASRDV